MKDKLKYSDMASTKNNLLRVLLFATVAIIFFSVFQDFLHSRRNGYSFFFSESLLFKVFWLFFPPILLLLKYVFQNRQRNTLAQMGLALISATLAHLILVPLTIWCLSALLREQSYGFIKTLTYTLANDLVNILLIYAVFILWLRYLAIKHEKEVSQQKALEEQPSSPEYLSVSSGKNNTRIMLNDILYIAAATPYIAIQLENRQFLHAASLKSIVKTLDARFIRIHKSNIVNIDKVLSYKSRLNGDYDLMLQGGTEIRLSRNYVNQFKNKFEPSPQLNP